MHVLSSSFHENYSDVAELRNCSLLWLKNRTTSDMHMHVRRPSFSFLTTTNCVFVLLLLCCYARLW
jgi:hypothetical protein